MRSYKFSKDDERPTEDKKAENERLMQEFLKKGGKIEKIPYGVTSQDLGVGNRNAFWDPPKTSTPKAWRRRETMKKKKRVRRAKSTGFRARRRAWRHRASRFA